MFNNKETNTKVLAAGEVMDRLYHLDWDNVERVLEDLVSEIHDGVYGNSYVTIVDGGEVFRDATTEDEEVVHVDTLLLVYLLKK